MSNEQNQISVTLRFFKLCRFASGRIRYVKHEVHTCDARIRAWNMEVICRIFVVLKKCFKVKNAADVCS